MSTLTHLFLWNAFLLLLTCFMVVEYSAWWLLLLGFYKWMDDKKS